MTSKISQYITQDRVKIHKAIRGFLEQIEKTKMRLEDSQYYIVLYTSICNASKVGTKIWEMRSSNIYYVNISSFREPVVESIQDLNFSLYIQSTTNLACNQKWTFPCFHISYQNYEGRPQNKEISYFLTHFS